MSSLATLIAQKTADTVGVTTPTAMKELTLIRITQPVPRTPVVYGTSICVVAQGAKTAYLGDQAYTYDEGHYLICSVTLPVESEVQTAGRSKPFLGLVLDVSPTLVGDLLAEISQDEDLDARKTEMSAKSSGSVVSTPLTPNLMRVAERMVGATNDPLDARVLGPNLLREAVYEVLRGPHGQILKQCVIRTGRFAPVTRVIRFLEKNFQRTLEIEEMAKMAKMSPSAFHRHFKQATNMSPIQYIKKLRLHHARARLLAGHQAGEVAFEVGYLVPSSSRLRAPAVCSDPCTESISEPPIPSPLT